MKSSMKALATFISSINNISRFIGSASFLVCSIHTLRLVRLFSATCINWGTS